MTKVSKEECVMKNLLRVAALTLVISAALLSEAHAGACSIHCNNGASWTGSTTNGTACCSMAANLCRGQGGVATYNGIMCDPDYWGL